MMNFSIHHLIWTLFLLLCKTKHVNCYLGINWGRFASQNMIPSMVVDMLLQNDIRNVKLFSAGNNVLEAFVDTNIGLTVTIPNKILRPLRDSNEAKKWVETYVVPYVQMGVDIRYVFPYSILYLLCFSIMFFWFQKHVRSFII